MSNILQGYYGKWYRGEIEPEMPNGMECREMIVSVQREGSDKHYEFSAYYLKDMPLYDSVDDEEDPTPKTGWYISEGPEDDPYFMPLLCNKGDKLIAWTYLPELEV